MINNTKKIKELYENIQRKLFDIVPGKWDELYLYASIIERLGKVQVGEMYFYFMPRGILKRIFIIDLYEENVEPYVFINPEIIKTKGEQTVEEGCLSFPNKFAKIVRPKEVVVRALNEKGEKFEIKAKDLFAQAISHETDHLNGELFIDKIIPGTLEILTPEQKD